MVKVFQRWAKVAKFRQILSHCETTLPNGGRITVWLTSCLTSLDSTKQAKMMLIQHKQRS